MIDPERTHLVTGGAGFIGSHLAEALVDEGATVRVLDDFSTGRRENLAPFRDRIELLEGSVTDPALCAQAVRGVDCVFHQAALPSVQRSVADPLPSHESNATGTLNLLIAARDAGVRRFIYAASSSAYGDTEVLPKREEMTPRPRSPYAVAKLTGESYCAAFHVCYGIETVALRYFNIYGPRQDPTSPYSAVIPIFIDRALEGRPPLINGDGEQSRDFTYVANAVRANLLACTADADGVAGEVFNVGCGERTTINGLWSSLRGILQVNLEAEHAAPRPGDVRHSLASLEKISARLDYQPSVGMEEGLRRTVAWFREDRGP